jgi:glycosyltransferase involved in cell wall biosynthesis
LNSSDPTDRPFPLSQAVRENTSRKEKVAVRQVLINALVRKARRLTDKRLQNGTARTLWASTPILTLPLLAECDRLLGFRSSSLVFRTYYITRSFDINLILFEGAFRLTRSRACLGLFRWIVFAWALLRFDAFNYFYDRGLLPSDKRYGINPEELEVLHQSGKRLYTYAYGADVRTRETTLQLPSPNLCQECPEPGKFCICSNELHTSSFDRLAGRTNAQIAMGDMVAYVPGCRDMHYWPIDPEKFDARPPTFRPGDTMRVAHAPNHGHFKGTSLLRDAIDRLAREGEKIELVSVQGVSNRKVIELFGTAHIVADQFVSGFHGYTTLEAMAMARPVLCFLRNDRMMIDPATCPVINTRPEEIYAALKKCLRGEIDLTTVGRSGRRYVEKHYSFRAVAARLGKLYIETANFPDELNRKLKARIDDLEQDLAS